MIKTSFALLLPCIALILSGIYTTASAHDYEISLSQASAIDNEICKHTQTRIGDIDNGTGITVAPVNPGSEFTSTKATVDNSTNTVIPVYKITLGTSDEIFENETINTTVWCKTRIPEAIKWNTGIDYTDNDAAAGTCKQVNEYIYALTFDLLTVEQKDRYNNEGKQIVFTDDTIVGEGIEFYALDQYSLIEDMGSHLNISSASLESDFDSSYPEDDRRGAKYCKIIASQNLLAWMLDGSFKDNDSLTITDPSMITCDDVNTAVGSCYFINEHSLTYFCEDYIGYNYTGGDNGTAKAKCDQRDSGVYVDGVICADRTDIDGTISGICVINESEDGAYAWTMYEPEGEDECPLRFLTCDATLVELSFLTAEPANNNVTLEWSTASEIDNAGFNIYRSTSTKGAYSKINDDLIPAKGTAIEGASYAYADEDVRNRKTYWYKLEDVDLYGTSTMHGPVKAVPRLMNGIGR